VHSSGIFPSRLLKERFKVFKEVKLARNMGMVPERLLEERSNHWRLLSSALSIKGSSGLLLQHVENFYCHNQTGAKLTLIDLSKAPSSQQVVVAKIISSKDEVMVRQGPMPRDNARINDIIFNLSLVLKFLSNGLENE